MDVEFIREQFRRFREDNLSERDFKAALKQYSEWLRQTKEKKPNDSPH